MNTDITYKIRPAGRHILTIGKDLIHDNYAAVIELVKNAYDADSPDVEIEFEAHQDHSGYSIVIADHGHGMSREDVINKWLVPSTSDKSERKESPSGRPMQGNKGVGRYAASILGIDLHLETVTPEGEKTTVLLEWNQFKNAQYLDDVEILVETIQVSEQHGTRLTMVGDAELLATWNKKQFERLQDELKKLKSPVSSIFGNDEFSIKLSVEGFDGVNNIKQSIEPYPFFDIFDYKISGSISEDGKGVLKYSSQKARNISEEKIPFNTKDEIANSLKKELQFDFDNSTGCGKLEIDIRVYDREPEAIESLINRGLKNESGDYVKKLDARRLLNEYNGIGVYRSGFRIRPLGDADFDWLKLNERRVQNPSLRIGSNQVIGYVQIQSEDQSDLIEKSARDGLKENQAFGRLKAITTTIIGKLETRRFDYRDKVGLSRSALKVEKNLQGLFSFDELKQGIETKLTKASVNKTTTAEIIELIGQDAEDKNKVVEEIRQAVAIYQVQAVLGQIVSVVIHEGRRPLSYFRNQIPNLKYWYESFRKTKDPIKLEKVMTIIDGIGQNAEFFVKLFRRLDPLAAGKRTAKKQLELKRTVEGTLSVFENKLKYHNIFVEIKGPDDLRFSSCDQDIYAIFTNLVDNSVYWISEKKVSVRKITIELHMDGNTLDYIDYHDTGPGIEPNLINTGVIFEPGFSTKPDGTGLGLSIAGEAAERNHLELKVFESDEGAHFRLQPKTENEK